MESNDTDSQCFLLIVGAMKCGTTSLFEYLRHHPAICPSQVKEPEFFSQNQRHRVNVNSYPELWPDFDSQKHRYAMEASTGYTKWPLEQGVAKRIAEQGISAKIIYIVRDPIARIESHFNFMQRTSVNSKSIDDPYLIDVSRYHHQIKPFTEQFSDANVLVLEFSELANAPEQTLERVYKFLQLDAMALPQYPVMNDTASKNYGALRRLVRSSKRLRRLSSILPSGLKQLINAAEPGKNKTEKVRLTPLQREHIRQERREDMSRLRDDFGIDIGKWGFDD